MLLMRVAFFGILWLQSLTKAEDEEMHDVKVFEIKGSDADPEPDKWGPRVNAPRRKNARKAAKRGTLSVEAMKAAWKDEVYPALKRDDVETVQQWLDKGFDVEATAVPDVRRLGYTPLVQAVVHQRPNVLKLLLEAGADPEVRTIWNTSPASIAAFVKPEEREATDRAIECLDVLQHYGCDIDGKVEDGWTPLFYTVRVRNLAIAQHLLQRGADPSTRETFNSDDPKNVTGVKRDFLDHAILRSSPDWADCKPGKPALQLENCQRMLHWATEQKKQQEEAKARAAPAAAVVQEEDTATSDEL